MPRTIPQRKRIFIAVEGEGEQAFCRWLQQLCDARDDVHLHLDVKNMGGGAPLKMVKEALECRKRRLVRGEYVESLLLLDADRPICSIATQLAKREGLQLIVQCPNQEGVLLRLHPGYEAQFPPAERAMAELRTVWVEYKKPVEFYALKRRFGESHLQAAAQHDSYLKNLLTVLGLL